MRKALLTAAAAAAVVTAGSVPALASAAPDIHRTRCAVAENNLDCGMLFAMGRHPGDVRVVVRTSARQRVEGTWAVSCAGTAIAAGDLNGRTPVRRHLLGQVKAGGRCRMSAGVIAAAGGSVTVVFSWISRQ